MGTTWRENYSFKRIFKARRERTGRCKSAALFRPVNPISGQTDSRVPLAVKKKRELFPGLPPRSPLSFALPQRIHIQVPEF